MRTCGACGETGHNKRTCKTAATEPPILASSEVTKPARGPRSIESYAGSRGPNTFDLDEETLEALDWYMETLHPGHLDRREARASVHGECVLEPEEDEHDTD